MAESQVRSVWAHAYVDAIASLSDGRQVRKMRWRTVTVVAYCVKNAAFKAGVVQSGGK